MRTETIEIKIYKYDEASPELQEKIRENFCNTGFLFDNNIEEIVDSLKALNKILGTSLDYSISCFGDRGDFIQLKGLDLDSLESLTALNQKDCPLTGVFYDHLVIESAIKAISDESEYLDDVLHYVYKECEYLVSHEAISEMCESNEYEFTEDGKIY